MSGSQMNMELLEIDYLGAKQTNAAIAWQIISSFRIYREHHRCGDRYSWYAEWNVQGSADKYLWFAFQEKNMSASIKK